jgi:hypothetical protein
VVFDDKIVFTSAFCSGNMSKVARSATGGPYAVRKTFLIDTFLSLISGFHKMALLISNRITSRHGSISLSLEFLRVRLSLSTSKI